jgi:hypothetical protein
VGYVLFSAVACFHLFGMSLVYATARTYTLCTSIEMLRDKEKINEIVREMKYHKCHKAIEMLFTLNYYMEQAQMLEQHTQVSFASTMYVCMYV